MDVIAFIVVLYMMANRGEWQWGGRSVATVANGNRSPATVMHYNYRLENKFNLFSEQMFIVIGCYKKKSLLLFEDFVFVLCICWYINSIVYRGVPDSE